MAIHAQSSCTLSTITDVEAVYTYYYLSGSTITVNEAPKDNVNPPGASTITVISDGESYVWQLTEPELNIIDNVIQTAVGKLYVIECVKFSDGTYDWGPLMTSSTYAAAKAAYNLSSQALTQATAANNATALLAGHFIYKQNTSQSGLTVPSANVVQTVLKNNVDVTSDPTQWEHNVHIGANGISLRYNEAIMAQLAANQSGNNTALRFYRPPTISGSTTTQGMLTMELTNSALGFFNEYIKSTDTTINSSKSYYTRSSSTPYTYTLVTNPSGNPSTKNYYELNVAAKLDTNGLVLSKGGIVAGTKGQTGYIYLSTENHPVGTNGVTINSFTPTSSTEQWRQVIGTKFGVTNAGTLYASNAVISGTITIGSGSNVYTKTEADGAFDASGAAAAAQSAAISAAATDATSKANAAQAAAEATASADATSKANAAAASANSYTDGKVANMATTTDIAQLKANYGICSTSASTRTKVVTCSNFELVDGNEITVYFSKANTQYSNSVQLNVNSKGAKDVWVANAVTSSTNQLLWGAGSYITFKYVTVDSSSYFIILGEPRSWYGASTTPANTAAKTDTTAVTGCVICKGAKIELAMTNNNTNTSATLNIQSTGAKDIYYGNTTTRPTVDNGHSWLGSSTATFTFDGQFYRMAGQTVISGDSITTGIIAANRIDVASIQIGQSQVNNLSDTLSTKASSDAEYSVEIITSNFDPTATGNNTLVTLTARVTKLGSTNDIGTISYQWYGDDTSLGDTAQSVSYNVPANATYQTYRIDIN